MARKKKDMMQQSEADVLSRNVSADYYNGRLRSQARRRVLRIILSTILVLIMGAGTAVASYVLDINSKLTGAVDVGLREVLTMKEAGEPFYILLVGVDKDEGRANDSSYGEEDNAYRTDSIMLTRLDPASKKVTMISLHRDTRVVLGDNGVQKINAAYSIGGREYTTKVVSEFAGVPISHYAEVDMDALAAVIDQIGGIDVVLDIDCIDPNYTGLELKAGPQHMDGHTAALFCRARHAYDAIGDGDRYRAANQRMVISAVAQKVLSSDPGTIAATVSTMASYVRTDMDVATIVGIATQFIGMNPQTDILSGMEPTVSNYVNETWYEDVDINAWFKMMERVNQGLSPTDENDVSALETSSGSGYASEPVYISGVGNGASIFDSFSSGYSSPYSSDENSSDETSSYDNGVSDEQTYYEDSSESSGETLGEGYYE